MRRRTPTLETGNAADAGAATRGWFVGDLAAWASSRGEMLDPSATPRQSEQLQVKWFVHPPGHVRDGWADLDGCWSLGVLVAGEMRFDFVATDGTEESVSLARAGDYVLWHGATHRHSWQTEGGCTFLTLRWPIDPDHDADHLRQGHH